MAYRVRTVRDLRVVTGGWKLAGETIAMVPTMGALPEGHVSLVRLARQRAGRCGRVAAGVCIRLYDEPDFNARPPFTDPEILRSSLAGVIPRQGMAEITA